MIGARPTSEAEYACNEEMGADEIGTVETAVGIAIDADPRPGI